MCIRDRFRTELPDAPLMLKIDATMISQALINLMKNAGEAIETKSEKSNVEYIGENCVKVEENENNIKEQAKLAKKDGDEKSKKKTDPKKKEVKTKLREIKKTKTPASKPKKAKKVSKK